MVSINYYDEHQLLKSIKKDGINKKNRSVARLSPLPLILIILITHGVVDGVVHHLLFHVHDFALFFKLHHDLLNLRQFQLWKWNKYKIVNTGGLLFISLQSRISVIFLFFFLTDLSVHGGHGFGDAFHRLCHAVVGLERLYL